MTTAPYVELGFNPTDLRPRDLPRVGAFLGSPADALEAALAVARAEMVDRMKAEVRGIANPTHEQILRIADLAWQAVFWKYRKISAPVMADAYIRAYRRADAGDVPTSVIYELADQHAEKIGEYFHTSSREALAEGFNASVNRRVPARAAADRVMDAYGLTPRQMRGYTAAKQFDTPVSDVLPRPLKAKARAYIDKAFTGRIRKLSEQEEHNIDQQAQQFAWMWLQDKGRLSEKAQKIWITARDERVCEICGPLHGKKVGVNEQFKTAHGEFWTPGLHPNCRCVIRLLENRFAKNLSGTALAEFNDEHPRGAGGRFGVKARTRPVKTIDVDTEFERIIRAQPKTAQPKTAEPKVDLATEADFAQIVAGQTETPGGFASPFASTAPVATQAPVFQAAKVEPAFKTDPNSQAFKTAVAQTMFSLAPPEARLAFATDLVLDTRAAVQADLQTKPSVRTKPPTTKLDHPAYAVLTRANLHEGDISRIDLNKGIEFSTSDIETAINAEEKLINTIENEKTRILRDYGRQLTMTDAKTGKTLYANLDENDLDETLEWFARTATLHHHPDQDPDSIGDERIPVIWYDEQGDRMFKEHVPYSYVGQKYDLDQGDFEVYMVRVDESHAGEEHVEDITGSATSKERTYGMDGWYELVPESLHRVAETQTYGVTTFKITPSGIHDPTPEETVERLRELEGE